MSDVLKKLAAVLEATERVDSTTGLQMAYLKQWSARSHRPLRLRLPILLDGAGRALRLDAREAVTLLGQYDVAYLDPPYNQHSYYRNYHVWETLVRGDAPPAYGVARKREDCRTTRSVFNARAGAAERALGEVLAVIPDVESRFIGRIDVHRRDQHPLACKWHVELQRSSITR